MWVLPPPLAAWPECSYATETDLKQIQKWVVPQDIGQSASRPSVGYAAHVTVPVLGDCWRCPLCPVTQCLSECVQCKCPLSVLSSAQSSSKRSDMKLLDDRIWSLFKRHWQQTLTYWSVFFSFGLCIAFLGPTILDLRCQTQSTLQQITWVFFSQQFFLLVGSSMGGLFKKTWV